MVGDSVVKREESDRQTGRNAYITRVNWHRNLKISKKNSKKKYITVTVIINNRNGNADGDGDIIFLVSVVDVVVNVMVILMMVGR